MKYDLEILSRSFFPWFWQNEKNLALVDVLISSLESVNQRTFDFEDLAEREVGYSIQRLSLEKSLNDNFDNTQRRIVVQHSEATLSQFIFNEAETITRDQDTFVFNESETVAKSDQLFVFNDGEPVSGQSTAFTVIAPASANNLDAELKAWVDRVLIFGTTYNIVYI